MGETDIASTGARALERFGDFQQENVHTFLQAVSRLVRQGDRYTHVSTGTEMVLFIGRTGLDYVDIQTQGGQDLRQLIVTLLRANRQAYQLYLNWQTPERTAHPHLPERVEKFTKGNVDQELLTRIYKRPEYTLRVSSQLQNQATEDDLILMTDVLNGAIRDETAMRKINDYEKKGGHYKKQKKPVLGGILGVIRKLEGGNKNLVKVA